MYFILSHMFGLAVDLFYRRRHVTGRVPPSGPVLLVANHPNGLIDPVLVTRVAGRPVRFLAKEPLFRMPVLGWVLRAARALPIYRAQDGHDTTANQDTFAAVYAALLAGDCVCLFPEGTSHSDPGLKPLKTGAARMALGAEAAAHFGAGVQIVPVGLNYRSKAVFRSEVAVEVGAPSRVDDLAELHARAPRDAAQALTDRIDVQIRAVTANLDAWEDLPLLELAGRVWDAHEDPTVQLRTFADQHRTFLAQVPDAVDALRQRLADFAALLDTLGLRPEDLGRTYDAGGVTRFVARNLVALTVGMPIAAAGALAYAAPYWTVRLLVRHLDPEHDVVSTYKVLGSMLIYPPWQLALSAALVWCWGPLWGVATAVALPFAALYTHRFLERRAAAWLELRVFFRRGDEAGLREVLRTERDALRAAIEGLVESV